jgi:hypothetical protein
MRQRFLAFVTLAVLLSSSLVWAQTSGVQVQPEDKLAKFLPATVFLDGENIPTQKRNATLIEIDGKKTVLSLVDTSGYSSAYQQKYAGVILTQGPLKIGSKTLAPGAYGFGQTKTGEHDTAKVTIHVYDLGGKEVAQIATERATDMKGVRPLQVIAENGSAQFYLGPNHVEIGAGK